MKKIGIIVFLYGFAISLPLLNTAILLEREGYEVHIFIDKPTFELEKIDFNTKNIVVHPIAIEEVAKAEHISTSIQSKVISKLRRNRLESTGLSSVIAKGISKIYFKLPILSTILYKSLYSKDFTCPSIDILYKYTRNFLPQLYNFYRGVSTNINSEYACIIGADANSTIASILATASSSEKSKIPVIYYNLELLLEKECRTLTQKITKSLERECNRRCYFTIIQDERRAKYLMDDNDISEEKIVLVPVSGLGEVYTSKSNYLHRILGIPQEKKIALYAGVIYEERMCLEIAKAAHYWDNDMVLVLHFHNMAGRYDAKYFDQVKSLADNKKVYLSLDYVAWELMPELLCSADIGLVFYKNCDENNYEIGRSSNKLVQYLQVGLPVITIDFPSLKEVVELYRCGECAKSPEEIKTLASKIFLNYTTYRENAFKCYEEEFEISQYFNVVIKKIKEISAVTS